jgi:hypothetical protein
MQKLPEPCLWKDLKVYVPSARVSNPLSTHHEATDTLELRKDLRAHANIKQRALQHLHCVNHATYSILSI